MGYTAKMFLKTLLAGAYAWPGGYPIFFVTSDGGVLSFKSAWLNRSEIVSALVRGDTRCGWHVFGADVNWEDADLHCYHSGCGIESAYADEGRDDVETLDGMFAEYRAWCDRIKGKVTP